MLKIFEPFRYDLKNYLKTMIWAAVWTITLNPYFFLFTRFDLGFTAYTVYAMLIGFSSVMIIIFIRYPIKEKSVLDINRALFLNYSHWHLLVVKIIGDIIKAFLSFSVFLLLVYISIWLSDSTLWISKDEWLIIYGYIFTSAGVLVLVATLSRMTLYIPQRWARIVIYCLLTLFYYIIPLFARLMIEGGALDFMIWLSDTQWVVWFPLINVFHFAGIAYGIIPWWTIFGPISHGLIVSILMFKWYARWNKEHLLL